MQDPFSKYGGSVVEDDPFAAYGGQTVKEESKPAAKASAPTTPAMMPQDAGIRPPLSFMEHAKNLGRDIFTTEALPAAGTMIGGALGNVPGAIVGGMAGKTAQNLGKAAGIGDVPPPASPTGELQDVATAGLKGGAEQAVAGAIHTGTTGFEPPAKLLPRTPVHPSVRDFTDAVGKTNNIHVEDTFRNAVNEAMPHLKKAEAKLGTQVMDIRDAQVIASEASRDAWVPYKHLLDSTSRTVDRMDLIKQAGQNLPPNISKTQARGAANIVKNWSKDLSQKSYTVSEIEDAAQALNVKLKAVYLKDGIDRAAASKMPQYAGDEALLKSYRQLQDSTIKADTGYDPAPLRQTYGNIKAVNNALLKSPSGDDTLFDIFKRDIPTSKAEVKGKILQKVTGTTPDQLVKKAFKNYAAPPESTALVHAGWETPTKPETGDVVSSQGIQVPGPTPPSRQLLSRNPTAEDYLRSRGAPR